MDRLLARIAELFRPERIAEWLAMRIPDLVGALLVLALFHLGWKLLDRLTNRLMRRAGLDETAKAFVSTLLRGVVATLGVITALAQIGVDTGSVLASLGVAGLTIGFAAKDTLSNVISGIFIFWDRPFVIGDLVEIQGQYGRVDTITMRSTRVVTVDGKMLAIPNSVIVNTTVTSYTNFPHLRIDVPLTVGLSEDYGRVAEILLEVAKKHPQFQAEPAPQVIVKSVNDYNVEVELQVWIDDETQHIVVRNQLRRQLYEALREASIDMPFETLQLAPIEVKSPAE